MGNAVKRIEKTVFISYRRVDSGWALAIYQSLTQRGFDVFIDYLGLGSGSFEREIVENIAARAHFLVLLTPTALDRVNEPGDWMRREIEAAMQLKRNIVPVFLAGFSFKSHGGAAKLTGSLSGLPGYNGLDVPDGYFADAINRLERQFLSVALDTVIHPASDVTLQSAQDQQAAAAGAARQLPQGPLADAAGAPAPATPAALPPAEPAASAPNAAAPEAAAPATPTIRIRGGHGVLHFAWSPPGGATQELDHHFQPDIVSGLIRRQMGHPVWTEDFGRMLFRLLVPEPLRRLLPQLGRVVLDVDDPVADIPWEMLLAQDPAAPGPTYPFSLRTRVTRRLAEAHRPASPDTWPGRQALVVANPSTQGFAEAFRGPTGQPEHALPDLPGAEHEGTLVADLLARAGFEVLREIGSDRRADDVIGAMMAQPWRVIHIAAHGLVDAPHRDGDRRSGVVLSDGVLLTAIELAALERGPELAFLDCSHLGRLDTGTAGGALGSSLLRMLVAQGARCIVVTGWAVNDDGANIFARVFYEELLRGQPFSAAVFAARHAVWTASSADITWGAFQAYGDPDWVLRA